MWDAPRKKVDWRQFVLEAGLDDPDRQYLYRGHSSTSWRLVPGLFRDAGGYDEATRRREKLNRFFGELLPRFIAEYCSFHNMPSSSVYDETTWIGIAQHYGLPTPLLDWSYSPMVALFFALRHAGDAAAIRVVRMRLSSKPSELVVFSPLPIPGNRRYSIQQGAFSYVSRSNATNFKFSTQIAEELGSSASRRSWLAHIDISLKSSEKARLGIALENMNLSGRVLFPDDFTEVIKGII